jgi:ribosomal-protein-alanine N-acetyltransferase
MANPSISVIKNAGLAFDAPVIPGVENPYRARYAALSDASGIDRVVKEAFGASAPPSTAARDMKQNNTNYIVAMRTSENGAPPASDNTSSGKGWGGRLRSLLSEAIGSWESYKAAGNIVGLVGIWTVVEQMHIVVIASRPTERRCGIGELLLIATIAEAIKIGAMNATLEVRKSNTAARSLYRKYGFTDVGIRHRYYANNREDAIIMSTPAFSNLSYRRSFVRRCEAYFSVRGKPELPFDPVPYLSLPE